MSRDDQCCDSMAQAIEPDSGVEVFYEPRFRAWVVQNTETPEHPRQIDFCPWCGVQLPEPLGEQRRYEMKRRGLSPLAQDDDLPADLLDDRWWKALEL